VIHTANVELMKPDYQGHCNRVGCHNIGVFKSDSGYWCARDLPLDDVPEEQMSEIIELMAIMSPDLEIDAEGRIRLAEEYDGE